MSGTTPASNDDKLKSQADIPVPTDQDLENPTKREKRTTRSAVAASAQDSQANTVGNSDNNKESNSNKDSNNDANDSSGGNGNSADAASKASPNATTATAATAATGETVGFGEFSFKSVPARGRGQQRNTPSGQGTTETFPATGVQKPVKRAKKKDGEGATPITAFTESGFNRFNPKNGLSYGCCAGLVTV